MFSNNYMVKRQFVFQIVGAALGTTATIGANLSADKTRKKLKKIGEQDPEYTESPYAGQELGLAETLYNARTPGAMQVEKNINQNQANTLANIGRNATDSSQALALAGGVQGQTNAAYNQLGLQEAQDQQRRYQNLVMGQRGMTAEHQAKFDDNVRRWQDQLGILMKRHQIRQQQWSNVSDLGSSFSSMGMPSFGGSSASNMGGGGSGGASGGGAGGGGGWSM